MSVHDQPRSIHDLFTVQAARTPEAVALISAASTGGQLTYLQLNQRANQLAYYLQSLGVGPEVLVGICVERSLEMVVGLLGILKAGGAYVPLDPAYPKDRLAFMMEDARISILITQRRLAHDLPGRWEHLICLDADWETIRKQRDDNPGSTTGPESTAYVIYTSGSTGRPKGVVGLHYGALNRFEWMWKDYPFEVGEVCCQKTTLSFADSIWEIFGPLLQGVPLVIIPNELSRDVRRLVKVLGDYRVTRIVLVPSLLRAMLDTYSNLRQRLPRLKYWTSSGEALPFELWKRFQQQLPGSVLFNIYGSSEVSADATWYDMQWGDQLSYIPIGRPIDGMQAYFLDASLRPVPAGEMGELYLGGVGLARGYLGRPGLTAERFLPDPSGNEPGARLYKTGDLARCMPDGNIEFLGRADYQVKIRGFRVELGEVEAALLQYSSIRQAVVVARQDAAGEKRLVAYVVPEEGSWPGIGDLRRFLSGRLPEYMLPSAFVVLDAFPLTPSGKIDRLALPAPAAARPRISSEFTAPRTPTEEKLAETWAEVLGLEQVGVLDDFFEMGGHSLLATRLVSYLYNIFQIELPVDKVFELATVASLAEYIDTLHWAAQSALPAEASGDREEGEL